MSRPTVADLTRRVDALETGTGPLSPGEAQELRQLQAEHDARFAGPIANWPDELIMDFVREQSAYDGPARRLDELRERARSPEQDAADRRRLAVFLDIEVDQVGDFTAAAIAQLTGATS